MKEVGKIYTSVDADELEAGDIVAVADIVSHIKEKSAFIGTLHHVNDDSYKHRFIIFEDKDEDYLLAKLVCPKKHVETYKAWKNGVKIEVHRLDLNGKWVPTTNPNWDNDLEYRVAKEEDPYAIFKKAYAEGKVIQELSKFDWDWHDNEFPTWNSDVNSYRIKPGAKKRLMTNRELAKWLAQGSGQFKYIDGCVAFTDFEYSADDTPVDASVLIRSWDEDEWHEPLVEVEE